MTQYGTVDRRTLLRVVGGGVLAGGLSGVAGADSTEQVFVTPRRGADAARAARDHGGTIAYRYRNFGFVVARVPERSLRALGRDARVGAVHADATVRATRPGNGPPGGEPPGGGGGGGNGGSTSQTPSWGYGRVGADEVTSADGTGVGVAVLDTGIDPDHPDLDVAGGTNCTGKGNGYEDKNGHGTHCAGIVAALDNSRGVVGVAPAARPYAVKVLDNSGSGTYGSVACGVDWAMSHGVPVLSMSLGGPEPAPDHPLRSALSDAAGAGHVLVAAAGNDGNDTDGACEEANVGFPATHDAVLGVSATDEDDTLAGYSSVGDGDGDGDDDVDLAAPGTAVRSTYKNGGYETLSGTSMACPHVSGAAALVWDAAGRGSVDGGDHGYVNGVLLDTAETLLGTCEEGDGLVRADDAVAASS